MSEIELKALEYRGAGQWRADIACLTEDEFFNLPYEISIDNFTYQKSAFFGANEMAYYFRPVKLEITDATTHGRFRVLTAPHGNLITTWVEVEEDIKK